MPHVWLANELAVFPDLFPNRAARVDKSPRAMFIISEEFANVLDRKSVV